jgi:hypothetical protein
LHQGGLHALLLGDVVREHEEAEVFALGADFRDQRALRKDILALALHLVFVGDLLAAQGFPDVFTNLAINVVADHVAHAAPGDRTFRVAVPVGIALVGVLINLVVIDVADQNRNGVIDQAQAFFAAPQGRCDTAVFAIGPGQVGVGVFELGGTAADALVELDVLVLGQVFDVTLFGDVGVQRDKPFVGQGFTAQQQDLARSAAGAR